jgi:hypothetical protein
MIIDPDGLFNGDRFRRCSNMARLYWPYFFLASNGFGRMEVNYHRIIARAFSTFDPVPAEHELMRSIKEYQESHLLFLYEFNGQVWGQWDCPKQLLNKYHNARDKRSPAPPEEEFQKWREAYRAEKAALPKVPDNLSNLFGKLATNSQEIPAKSSRDLPLGVGVGVGVGKKQNLSASGDAGRSVSKPKEANPDFDRFWSAYPRKADKRAALKAWRATLKRIGGDEHAAAERIIGGVQKYAKECAGRDRDKIKYPASFLNADSFDNYKPEASSPAPPSAVPMERRVEQWRAAHQVPQDRTFHEQWIQMRQQLRRTIDAAMFEVWFKPVWAGGLDRNGRLHLLCPDVPYIEAIAPHTPAILNAAKSLNYELSAVLVEVA